MSSLPIADYALLSDRHSAALVSSGGSVDWLCMPRFDSPSIFAAILEDEAGHWSIRPDAAFRVEREYVAGSIVILTKFHTSAGTLELRDALTLGDTHDPHSLGEHAPHLLARTATCTRGSVSVIMSFRARPEYGLVLPVATLVDGGLMLTGGANRLALSSTVPLDVEREETSARFELHSGEGACFGLEYSALGTPDPATRTGSEISALIHETVTGWQEWSELHQNYQGPWCDLVHHSGRVLQALSYQPTGAIVAAPTTSLPEQVGGERNWDYRYSWVRDASMTMQALWVAACPDEAHEFFDFMADAAAGSSTDRPLQIMFGVGGEHDLSERTLPHLSGWRGSGPVRVGNGAWNQPQLDVYGELLDAASQLRNQLGLSRPTRDFLVGLADSAAVRWNQPDNGIWEVRGDPRHFVHSKVMCWVALDRAIGLADLLDAEDRVAGWRAAAEEIRTAVETQGWDEDQGAFTQSFGSPDLDATVLLLPIVGFLPPDDPRVLSSIDAVREQLTDARGLVHTGLYRYFRLKLVDSATAWRLIALTLPLGMLGALASAQAPVQALRLGYGVAMVALAVILIREAHPAESAAVDMSAASVGVPDCGAAPGAAFAPTVDSAHPPCPFGTARHIEAADGTTYTYCVHGLPGQQLLSGIGAFFAGLISTGVGEATLPGLVRRSKFPLAVAAATSTVVVAGTVVGAALTHMTQLAAHGGLSAIPWDLIVWAMPGAVLGALLGTGVQGKVSPTVTRWFFSGLFLTIGVTFLLAFTIFRSSFS